MDSLKAKVIDRKPSEPNCSGRQEPHGESIAFKGDQTELRIELKDESWHSRRSEAERIVQSGQPRSLPCNTWFANLLFREQ